MAVRRRLPAVALVILAAGCAPGGQPPETSTTGDSGKATETTRQAAKPSITREVPPEQRQSLADLPPEQLCALASPDELRQLAFAVEPGQPRQIEEGAPAKGCSFPAPSSARSILIASQPQEYGKLGVDEVELGSIRGTKTLSANDCTVFTGLDKASLQVTVTATEADSDQCETAEAVAQFVLPALVR